MTKLQRKSLKKLARLTIFFLMKKEKQITISLVMLLSKELVGAVKVLEVLILHLSQIFLKIFLVTLVEVVLVEDQAIVEMT